MRFYTHQECEKWLSNLNRQKPDAASDIHVERINYPPESYRTFFVAHWIATSLTHRMPSLLRITEWSVWPNSENWHLYYSCARATETNDYSKRRPDTCSWSTRRKTSHPSCKLPC